MNIPTPAYFKPSVTADIAVFYIKDTLELLLIERKRDPFANHWALPGGFIEANETLIESARRELEEETGLALNDLNFFNVYGDPGRDSRGRTITMVYYCILFDNKPHVTGQDDAKEAQFFPISDLPKLAFDHAQICGDLFNQLSKIMNQADLSPPLPQHIKEKLKAQLIAHKKKTQDRNTLSPFR